TEARQRSPNVKDALVREHEFQTLRLQSEQVAEFPYRPTACKTEYRMVVVRKNISKEKGELRLHDEILHFFCPPRRLTLSSLRVAPSPRSIPALSPRPIPARRCRERASS